jgi:NAD-dependent dihydropyrimidine dehydrogenase PreA subunit
VDECPNKVLKVVNDVAEQSKPENCDGCGKCAEACPNEAIKMQ